MLTELVIRDLALLERAELCFGAGLNVATGETGAGKSLLIGALELLLGRRPRGHMVRRGAQNARVEGRFFFPEGGAPPRLLEVLAEGAPAILEEHEEGEELELVLSRTVGVDGKTRAHLNQRPVTRRFLRELAGLLVEIHGQNDHQKLLDPLEQLALVDAFGGLEPKLAAYRERRERWLEFSARLATWAEEEAARTDRLDLLRFQIAELVETDLTLEGVESLRRERERLRHAEELAVEVGGALGELAEEDGAALDVLRRADSLLERWEQKISDLAAPAEEVREATIHLEEAVARLREVLDGLEFSPDRLELVEARLAEVDRLQRKHRVDLPGLVSLHEQLEEEQRRLEAEVTDFEACEGETEAARAEVEESAAALSRARSRLRARLRREVELSLAELGLEKARFEVRIEARESEPLASPNADPFKAQLEADSRRFRPDGIDGVEFLLASNPGEGTAPLREVASGGEAARIMLALRGALAARHDIPCLIFDEIDAGVGGRLAPRVGAHLRALAEHYQILCVTHLPAVAALANRHLEVEKRAEGKRTITEVREVEGTEREVVIADMIAGGADQKTARAEARRLLRG